MTDPDPDDRYVYRDTNPCPRCGGTHYTVQFTKFNRPVDHRAGTTDVRADYWALCPGTSEPIILLQLDDNRRHQCHPTTPTPPSSP